MQLCSLAVMDSLHCDLGLLIPLGTPLWLFYLATTLLLLKVPLKLNCFSECTVTFVQNLLEP